MTKAEQAANEFYDHTVMGGTWPLADDTSPSDDFMKGVMFAWLTERMPYDSPEKVLAFTLEAFPIFRGML